MNLQGFRKKICLRYLVGVQEISQVHLNLVLDYAISGDISSMLALIVKKEPAQVWVFDTDALGFLDEFFEPFLLSVSGGGEIVQEALTKFQGFGNSDEEKIFGLIKAHNNKTKEAREQAAKEASRPALLDPALL